MEFGEGRAFQFSGKREMNCEGRERKEEGAFEEREWVYCVLLIWEKRGKKGRENEKKELLIIFRKRKTKM